MPVYVECLLTIADAYGVLGRQKPGFTPEQWRLYHDLLRQAEVAFQEGA